MGEVVGSLHLRDHLVYLYFCNCICIFVVDGGVGWIPCTCATFFGNLINDHLKYLGRGTSKDSRDVFDNDGHLVLTLSCFPHIGFDEEILLTICFNYNLFCFFN